MKPSDWIEQRILEETHDRLSLTKPAYLFSAIFEYLDKYCPEPKDED